MYKTPRHKQNERLIIQCWADEDRLKKSVEGMKQSLVNAVFFIFVVLLILCSFKSCAHADELIEGYSLNQWAEAIHKAEGNDNYGILAHYKHTSYKQACINTVKHVWIKWNIGYHSDLMHAKYKAFLPYLASRYAPIGVDNDPKGLNKNWQKNVKFWLGKA